MRAVVEGQDVHPEEIALDLLRWEGDRSRGSDQLGPQRKASLRLMLDGNDLASLGRKLNQAYEDYLREDEDFFARPHMEDVPLPVSAGLFAKDPLSIRRYLSAESFWRRKTGEAIASLANPFRTGTARWLVEGFREARIEGGELVIELAARGY